MERSRRVAAVGVAVVVLVSGVGIYWEWLRPAPSSLSGCPSTSGGLGGAPPEIFTLNNRLSWTWERTPTAYIYNVTFAYLVSTASTNWTGLDLINRTFAHSLIDYTVRLLASDSRVLEVFNASESSWRSSGGSGAAEGLTNWTPMAGAPIQIADVLQFQSPSNLTASGLFISIEMAATSCGPTEGTGFIL